MRVRFIFEGKSEYVVNISAIKDIHDLWRQIGRAKDDGYGFLCLPTKLININKVIAIEVEDND